jgi:hypothetical protein
VTYLAAVVAVVAAAGVAISSAGMGVVDLPEAFNAARISALTSSPGNAMGARILAHTL